MKETGKSEDAKDTKKQSSFDDGQEKKVTRLMVSGLDCASCAEKLKEKVASLEGVGQVQLNFGAGTMVVEHINPCSRLLKAVSESGYAGWVQQKGTPAKESGSVWQKRRTQLTLLSGLLLGAAVLGGWLGMPPQMVIALYAASMAAGGFFVVRMGLYSLKALSPDMNLLMIIAALGAVAIGEWSEGAVVVFLFSLGNTLQSFSMDKTRRSLKTLMELAPKEALVVEGGQEWKVPVKELSLKDVIRVKPGERIPMDGEVIKGFSAVDQSPVTGESMPVEKGQGEEVFAGTVNGQGSLDILVTKLSKDNTISRIMHLVEQAQAQKAPTQQFVDVFARYYTPAVILSALAVAFVPMLFFRQPFQPWFYRALVLLVISCPCALVISTPVSIVSAIGSASRNGLLVKGGAYLEELSRIKTFAFDKTGTLTEGRPVVKQVLSFDETGEEALLMKAASVERYSEHPLGKAIVKKAQELDLSFPEAEDFQSRPGIGVLATVQGKKVKITSPQELKEKSREQGGVDLEKWTQVIEDHYQQGHTIVMVKEDDRPIGLIALYDPLRKESIQALKQLKEEQKKVVMLTGDNPRAARAVAAAVGMDEVKAGLLPEDKVEVIRRLAEKEKTAMVGDGVNDAPALAASSIGIAMGAAGTDTALETADVALMSDDLSRLIYGVALSRKTLVIMKQNIVFSVAVKGVFLTLAALGMANLWMAVFADTGAALLVIANGMRLTGAVK